MADWRHEKTNLASKCEFFWTTNSDLYGDVTFLVGPKEEKIKCFKILLMITSPVFETMFGTTWTTNMGHDGPIKLSHIDPLVFRHFVRLMLMDTTSTQSIEVLKLSMSQVLELFFLSKEYLVKSLRDTIEEYIKKNLRVDTVLNIYQQIHDKDEEELKIDTLNLIVRNAPKVFEQDDFLKISQPAFLKILSSENLCDVDELSLFHAGHRWAEFQATWDETMGDENNEEKVVQFLRVCLPEIRLPLITCRDWGRHVEPKGVLTKGESVELLKYLVLMAEERKSLYGPILQLSDSLSMKTEVRTRSPSRLVLSHPVDTPSYTCTGDKHYVWLRTSKNVWIRELGFCGPLDGDSAYKVVVSLYNYDDKVESAEEKKLIFAKEKSNFYFPLDTPVLMEEDTWYRVCFKLKGADTGSTESRPGKAETTKNDGIKFIFHHVHRQFLEILYILE